MSDLGLIGDPDDQQEGHDASQDLVGNDRPVDHDGGPGHGDGDDGGADDGGPRRPLRSRGWIGALLVLVLLAGGVAYGGNYAYQKLKGHFASAPDFAGPGAGKVVFEVRKGESVAAMGNGLRRTGVVKSVDSFIEAARRDSRSSGIQVGFYQLKKQMASADALAVLVNPKNQIQSVVTVTEGARVRDVVGAIVRNTDLKRSDVRAALRRPASLGLPAAAKGKPEGYLFPATYTVPPNLDARGLLRQMVAKTVSVETSLDIATRARKVGLDVNQVLTVASILEYEGNRSVDYPKIARVIYNRLKQGMALQLDSTVTYLSKRKGDVYTTAAERANPSPYNTYAHTGLPPGPIGSPGQATIEAALSPAKGRWLYFVPDLQHNTTHFSDTLAEHQVYVDKLAAFCRTSPKC